MPTNRERQYYRMGYSDGIKEARKDIGPDFGDRLVTTGDMIAMERKDKRKRKLSSWQKFIKANSNKKKFKYANGKLKLKTMGIAYRKTAAYKRNKKK